jgi:S1-C subfamily serine protease
MRIGLSSLSGWATIAACAWLGAGAASIAAAQEFPRPRAQLEPRLQAGMGGMPPQGGTPTAPLRAERASHAFRPAEPLDDGLTPDERVNIAVYENCNRSVVNITTEGSAGTALLVFDIVSKGAGSGSVLDQRGHILTNYHVIEGAKTIEVTLFDGNAYEGRLVGRDPTHDLAILKIDAPAESLFPVTLGDSTHLRVGQRVFAIGNPFGLERTLTTGIVSSLNRSLPSRGSRTIKSIIQIDAAINPGNSGGPLLDSRGTLIGMNTAIASTTGQNTGVGFAIPASIISRVVPQLIEKGKVIRPDSGITHVTQLENGLRIEKMTPGGPAERAGLRGARLVKQVRRRGPFTYEVQSIDRSLADVVVAVDGEKIATPDEFLNEIEAKRPGEEAVLTVLREGREVLVAVRLVEGES